MLAHSSPTSSTSPSRIDHFFPHSHVQTRSIKVYGPMCVDVWWEFMLPTTPLALLTQKPTTVWAIRKHYLLSHRERIMQSMSLKHIHFLFRPKPTIANCTVMYIKLSHQTVFARLTFHSALSSKYFRLFG